MTMNNPPFEDVFPIEHEDFHGFSDVMLVFRSVTLERSRIKLPKCDHLKKNLAEASPALSRADCIGQRRDQHQCHC